MTYRKHENCRRRAEQIALLLMISDLTTKEIQSMIGVGRNATCEAIRELHGRVHIVSYDPPPSGKGQHVPRYRYGQEVSLPRPCTERSRRKHENNLRYK